MRSFARASLERALVLVGAPKLAERGVEHGRLVLAYHNIVPNGLSAGGDASLHLPQREFARQLDLLQRHVDVVSLEELLAGAAHRGRPRVAITFDDAYLGTVTAGVEELHNRELPATIFVPPGCLGGRSFWWDVLASTGGMDPRHRDHALHACAGKDDEVRAWASANGLPMTHPSRPALTATADELRAALAHPGLLLGCHTWTHPNLTRSTDAELEIEMARPLDWLRAQYPGRAAPWVAYPYGMADDRVQRAAERAGYTAGFRVQGGWLPPEPPSPFDLPRLNVPAGLSIDGFRLRVAGLFCS